MTLPMYADRPTPICRPGAVLRDVIEGDGLPGGPAPPRELDGARVTPNANAVAHAIEELRRSGYRPLHARLAAPELSAIPPARGAPGREGWRRSSASHRGRHPSLEENVS